MRTRLTLVASVMAICSLALSAHAAPPEGKGPGNYANNPGKGNPHASGNPGKGNSGRSNASVSNPGKGGPNMRANPQSGPQTIRTPSSRRNSNSEYYYRYDDRGRHYDHFDHHRDRHGRFRSDDLLGGLVYAGITAALARQYVLDSGLTGYSALPPGIRKNLARGKPLPPGIAKKLVPGSLLGRLPRHPGYEWRIAGTDLILISVATAVIADILYDVFD